MMASAQPLPRIALGCGSFGGVGSGSTAHLASLLRVIAEGAGALAPAATLARWPGGQKVVCIVSGGNIDSAALAEILRGGEPQ